MRLALDIVSTGFLALGAFVALTGAVGLLRMPDFYSRVHPAGKNDSLAQALMMVGLLLQTGDPGVAARLVLITVFVLLTSPVATHAVTRAAYLDGLKVWKKEGGDDA